MCTIENFSVHEWEKEKMDKLVEETKLHYAREEGMADGFELGKVDGRIDGINELVKNMLIKNTDINFISEVSNLSVEQIMKIKESL